MLHYYVHYNPNLARILGVAGAGVPGSFLPGVTIAVLQANNGDVSLYLITLRITLKIIIKLSQLCHRI